MKKALKYLYSLIPFKSKIFTVVRTIFNPGEKIYRHLHFKGPFKVTVKENISFLMHHYGYQVENDIFWKGLTGRWEKKSIEVWMKLSEKAMVVMDIGANTGIYSLVTKSLNPASRVMAFEPAERVYKKLECNIRANKFDIESFSDAISDHKGETIFYDTYDEHTYTSSINKDLSQDNSYHPIKVKITTIDDFIRENQLSRLDLIKIDVEYHEPEVFKGFSQIGKYRPAVLVEILTDDIALRIQKEIENYGGGYLYFDIDEEKGIRQVDQIRKSSGMNYLLCTENTAKELQLL